MMDVYDKQQIILSKKVSEFSELAYYEKIKYEIKKLQNNLNGGGDTDTHKLINELSSLIKPPQLLLNQQRDIQNNFIFSNTTNQHEIFKSLLSNLDNFDSKIETLKEIKQLESLKSLGKLYRESHLSFIEKLVGKVNSTKPNTSVDIFKTLPLVITEDLEINQIKSLELSYQMVSYDNINHEYKRKYGNGLSIGGFLNDVYLKVDNGSGLLKPSREYAIYQLYKSLFQQSDHSIISPTQLLVLSNLQILSPDIAQSNVRKELIQLKIKYNTTSIEEVLHHQPDFRNKLENALIPVREIFVQASLKSNGITLEHYLNGKNELELDYSDLDFESFSSHIISSLLVIPTDYKSDNLIVENGTGRIIGIDNDEALHSSEFIKTKAGTYVKTKNILYTFKPLMNKPIHEKVRNQIIQHNPNLFILKWLQSLESKQSNYQSLISLLLNLHVDNVDENQINKAKYNIQNALGIPLQFNKGWINLMVSRFKLIIKLLNKCCSNNNVITHQDLFSQVHPYASLYYESLSKEHKHPLDQISSIYNFEFTFEELFEKYPPPNQVVLNQLDQEINQIDDPISILDSIKELISTTNYNDLSDSPIALIEFINLVLSDDNISNCFNQTWHDSKLLILITLIQNGVPIILVDTFIKQFNITKTEIENYSISILHTAVLANNINIIDQIRYLINEFNLDIEKIEDGSTPLDLSVCLKSININLVNKLISFGAGKLSNPSLFCKFYKRLSNDEKLKLKPLLDKLFHINPKISWKISLNQLFPISNNIEGVKYLSEVIGNGKRIIPDNYWNQLFNIDGTVKKLNEQGTRAVTLIQDEYGNGIYFKFEPQFPGTELAVIRLSELIFGSDSHLSPYCELVSINNLPVLLIQRIPGKTLFEILNQDPTLIDSIDSSNISKQLVMAMISNNGDGNLGNFIINENKLYSIDNDQSFMPPISKNIGSILFSKQSLQVETVLLLFNQMNNNVHQNVFDSILKLDIFQVVKSWLINLQYHHQSSLDHFKSNRNELKNKNQTVIGISFINGMVEQLYSKLKRLQQQLVKFNKSCKSITHNQLLEILEPLISNRYKQINSNINLSIIEKYSKLKNITTQNISTRQLTCSTHPITHLLESRDIPNSKNIQDELWSGKFGPSEALKELNQYESNYLILDHLFENSNGGNKNIKPISDHNLESILKNTDFSLISTVQFKSIINLIKTRELKYIYFKNSIQINSNILKQFKPDSIVKMDLSGSSLTQLDFITLTITATIFNSLISLKLNNCLNLTAVKLIAPNLKVLKLSNCKQLSNFNVNSPGLLHLNLKASKLDTGNLNQQFKQLEYLNLSERLFDKESISFDNLKCLDINSMVNLNEVQFKLPCIESINLENCKKELTITVIDPNKDYSNLINTLNGRKISNEFISFLKKHLGSFVHVKNIHFYNETSTQDSVYIPQKELHVYSYNGVDESVFKNTISYSMYDSKVFFHDGYNRRFDSFYFGLTFDEVNLYNVKYPLEVGTLKNDNCPGPNLKFQDGYNHLILPGVIPFSVKEIHIYDIGQPLINGSIPGSKFLECHSLYIHERYRFQLTSGIFLKNSNYNDLDSEDHRNLHLFNIQQPLIEGSLPTSGINFLILRDGFNHPLTSNILRNIIKLCLCNIGSQLTIGSLPDSLKRLILCNGFSCKLLPGIIPNSVEELYIGNIKHSLEIGSIPNSVKILQFDNGFNHPLKNGIIPNSVKELHIGDIKHNISIGSIPNGIRELIFGYGFSFEISRETIPDSTNKLCILDIKQPLTINSIPKKLMFIYICTRYPYNLSPNIFSQSNLLSHGEVYFDDISERLILQISKEQK